MRRIFFTFFLLIAVSSTAYAETLTLTTYYPAPFGAYDRLRLIPHDPAPACDDTLIGSLYINAANELLMCRGTALGWEFIDTIWTQNGDDVYLTDTLTNLNLELGIGTTTPQVALHVFGGDVLLESSSTNIVFSDTTDGPDFELSVWQDLLEFNSGSLPGALTPKMVMDVNGNLGIGVMTPRNKLDVEGGVVIGAGYSGTRTAPANGLLIQGSFGIGTNTTRNKLDVEGGVVIGDAYSGAVTVVAPANGLLVEGNVGIGDITPDNKVDIVGRVVIGAAYAGSRVAPNNGLEVQGDVDIDGQLEVGGEVTISNADRGRIDFDGGAYIYDDGTRLILGN